MTEISSTIDMEKGLEAYPALKWAGGKRQLIPHLARRFPKKYRKFIDPFMGALAIPLHLRPQKAYLSDANEELVTTHIAIRDCVEKVIDRLEGHVDDKDYFNALRSQNWKEMDPVSIAARMIYLNKSCFNGLYRVNKEGNFNVSYAAPQKNGRRICNPEKLVKLSSVLKSYKIKCCDFRVALLKAEPGDLVFLDPPYHKTFSSYTVAKFSIEDQKNLASEFKRLEAMGCYVIGCNSNNDFISRLYAQYEIETVDVRRSINCDKNKRTATEVVIYSKNKIPANDDA